MVLQHSPSYLTSQVNGYMEYTHVTCCLEFLMCYNCWNSTLNTFIHMQFYFLRGLRASKQLIGMVIYVENVTNAFLILRCIHHDTKRNGLGLSNAICYYPSCFRAHFPLIL